MSPPEPAPSSDLRPLMAQGGNGVAAGPRYVAECFWVGVTDQDLTTLDERVQSCIERLSRAGEAVRYLGSILIRVDEVVLCRFDGSEASVRRAAECARIPFARIVAVSESLWAASEGQ